MTVSGADITAIFNALASVVTAVGVLISIILSFQSKRQSQVNTAKIDEVKMATDGLTTKLVEATGRAERSEGKLEGQTDARVAEKESRAADRAEDRATAELSASRVIEGVVKTVDEKGRPGSVEGIIEGVVKPADPPTV